MRARRSTVVTAALALVAAAVSAQVQWYERYNRGLALEQQGQWEAAFRELEAAARVEPRPRQHIATYGRNYIFEYDPHYHMARCLVELGRYPLAVAHLRTAAKAGVTPRPKLDELKNRIDAGLRERLALATPAATATPEAGKLIVSSDPEGADVTLDGRPIGTTPLGPLPLPPGEHTVRLASAGFAASEETVTIEAGSTYTLDLALRPLVAAPAAAATTVAAAAPPPTAPPRRTAGAAVVASASPTATPAPPPVAPTVPTARPATVVVAPAAFTPVPLTGEPGAGGSPAWLLGAAGGLGAAALAAGGVWWLAYRRRMRQPAYTPTRVLEDTPTQIKAGSALGGYSLTGLLGRGGMATTYRATRAEDGTPVALKVPHESCLADPTYQERFLREGRLGEQLHHPRIVRIYEASEHEGRPFLAMELLEGQTLKHELKERAPLPVKRSLEITADIAEALDYAHSKGVIHRDLKPENVMVLLDGTIKVMDFGIARLEGLSGLTSSQFFLGTPLYAAPEMIEPKRIDHRVDLYSLGIIMFEMLQGTVPFSADSPFKVLQMHQHDPLPARSALAHPVPERVWSVIERLCAKRPDDRPRSAEALLVELHAMLRNAAILGIDRA